MTTFRPYDLFMVNLMFHSLAFSPLVSASEGSEVHRMIPECHQQSANRSLGLPLGSKNDI